MTVEEIMELVLSSLNDSAKVLEAASISKHEVAVNCDDGTEFFLVIERA